MIEHANQSPPPHARAHPSFSGRIGVARVDITPPIGIYARNWGAAKHDTADSIHRPLTLTALTLAPKDGGSPLVFLDADLGWWRSLDTFRAFQEWVLSELSLEPSALIFGLSHTHAGPPLMDADADSNLPGSGILASWLDQVRIAAVQAAREALARSFEAVLDWHTGRCGLAAVRDLPDPATSGGAGRFLCGYNPNMDADDTLLVGRITDTEGGLRATVTNYACHPTTLAWENTAISPDYVGAMRETIETATGAPALFMLGACGDLAPRHQYVGDPEIADRHGRQLGFASLAVLHDMEPPASSLAFAGTMESGAPLAVWRHVPRDVSTSLRAVQTAVDLPLKDWPGAAELERQRAACSDRALEERLRRKRDIRRALGDGRAFRLPLWAWRIGDAVLAGSCCEPYSVLQQELRQRFPDLAVVCLNLINGSIGYLPPAELYDNDVYPVWQTPFARGSLEQTIDAMAGAIRLVTA